MHPLLLDSWLLMFSASVYYCRSETDIFLCWNVESTNNQIVCYCRTFWSKGKLQNLLQKEDLKMKVAQLSRKSVKIWMLWLRKSRWMLSTGDLISCRHFLWLTSNNILLLIQCVFGYCNIIRICNFYCRILWITLHFYNIKRSNLKQDIETVSTMRIVHGQLISWEPDYKWPQANKCRIRSMLLNR